MTMPAATPSTDLLAHWRPGGFFLEQHGAGVAAAGVVRRGVVPVGPNQVGRAMQIGEHLLSEGEMDGAIVAGALPFVGDTEGLLVVPAVMAASSRPSRDVAADAGVAAVEQVAAAATVATGLEWTSALSRAGYAQAVNEAVRLIADGRLRKVVLARMLTAHAPGLTGSRELVARLRRRDPGCHVFAAPTVDGGVFVGASPETLVRRNGNAVISMPHAGTASRSTDDSEDQDAASALLRSAKDRLEHAPVVEAVADSLAPFCSKLAVDREPHLIATSAVWHLATAVRGTLKPSAPSALGLAAALHPTPAVCGTPRDAAMDVIARLEPESRGLYAGIVGWVDRRGDGEWAVSLRCATLSAGAIRLGAGAGIVAESDPDAEVAETEVKFRTLMDALAL